MKKLMTKEFSKWATKQKIHLSELAKALDEVQQENFEANLGANLYKKRIRFAGQGKRGSGRTILCYKRNNVAIYIHGFAKNEKSNLTKKELKILKEFAKILLSLDEKQLSIAIKNGDLLRVLPCEIQ